MKREGCGCRRTLLLVTLLVASLAGVAPDCVAPDAGEQKSTVIDMPGNYGQILLNEDRGLLFLLGNTPGREFVTFVNATTFVEEFSWTIPGVSRMRFSPSRNRLATASSEGVIHVFSVSPHHLEGTIEVEESPGIPLPLVDVAFDGEDRVIATCGLFDRPEGYPLALGNLSDFTFAGWLNETAPGFVAGSSVIADQSLGLLFVLGGSQAAVFSLAQWPPVFVRIELGSTFDYGFDYAEAGSRFFFSNGDIVDSTTLSVVGSMGKTGTVAVHWPRGKAYYGLGYQVFETDIATKESGSPFALMYWANEGFGAPSMQVDGRRELLYATTREHNLEVVRLAPALQNPDPPDGAWVPTMPVMSFQLSGDVVPSSARLYADTVLVSTTFDSDTMRASSQPNLPFDEGIRHLLATAVSEDGSPLSLEWDVLVDRSGPRIFAEGLGQVYRTTPVVFRGHVEDLSMPAWIEAYGKNQSYDLANGTFEVELDLVIGRNCLGVTARDAHNFYNSSSDELCALYIPPTRRYVDQDARFSIEYPTDWEVSRDSMVGGERVEVLAEGQSPSGTRLNLNVIALGDIGEYTQTRLGALADDAISLLEGLPQFVLLSGPLEANPGGYPAVTYAFRWKSESEYVYQRQYAIADKQSKMAWVLTFTSVPGTSDHYDAVFQWFAETFRVEPAVFPLQYVLAAGGVSAAIGCVAGILWIRKRRRRIVTAESGPEDSAGPPESS